MPDPALPAPSMFRELTAPGTVHKCIITEKKYIPEHRLVEIVTVPKIKAAIHSRWNWLRFSFKSRALDNTFPQARKVIAVLAIIGKLNEESLKCLEVNGITDEDLPLCAQDEVLLNRHESKPFKFQGWEEPAIVAFLEKQWLVLAPILDLKDGHPMEVQLDENCALEFSKCEDKGSTHFSHVFLAEIPPQNEGGTRRLVAVKKFLNDAFKNYTHERSNLSKIHAIKNDHLLKHLATCDQIPCIIFPWAVHGDLKQYWASKPASERSLSVFVWSIEQLSGLASALRDLHKINCRHGDLKPSNIFYFDEGGLGVLKIADVGVSKVHSISTNLRQGETATRASTQVYEGPEAYRQTNAPRSRTYDCWSMGCIILEFVIWLLYDQGALDGFYWSRDSECHSYYRPMNPIPTPDDRKPEWWERMERHPNVDLAIKTLREDARVRDTALDELVDLVDSKLLLISPKSRLGALGIAQTLQTLLDQCNEEQTPWVNLDKMRPTLPSIFTQQPPETQDTFQPSSVTATYPT